MDACSFNAVSMAAVIGFWLTMFAIPIAVAWVKVTRIRHQAKAA
jgi:hypothetical protein